MRFRVAVLLLLLGASASAQAGTAFYDPIYGVSSSTNLTYGTGLVNNGANTLDLKLDLYRPTNIGNGALPAVSPVILIIHGGGFFDGDKSDLAGFAAAYVPFGYTVASINYRMYDDNVPVTNGPADGFGFPPPPFANVPVPQGGYTINAAVEDASKAMGWLRDNAALYGMDANHIAIGGFSAGAITALLQAYNSPAAHVAPQAVLSFSGAMYGTEASIHAGAAPAFVVHGTADDVVPFSAPLGIQAAVTQMNAVGVYNEFYAQSALGHTTDFNRVTDGLTLFAHSGIFLRNFLVPEPASLVTAAIALCAFLACSYRRRGRRIAVPGRVA